MKINLMQSKHQTFTIQAISGENRFFSTPTKGAQIGDILSMTWLFTVTCAEESKYSFEVVYHLIYGQKSHTVKPVLSGQS